MKKKIVRILRIKKMIIFAAEKKHNSSKLNEKILFLPLFLGGNSS